MMQIVDGLIGNTAGDNLNTYGHRCKNIEEINFNNYFLIAGDNFNLSFDKPIEETYPYILSKILKTSYYNISVFNGGMDVFKNNMLIWKNKFPSPKFVLIHFSFLNSLTHYKDEKLYSSNFEDKAIVELFETGNYNGYFNAKQLLISKLILNYYVCPIYQLYDAVNLKLFDNLINQLNIDNLSHLDIADILSKQITSYFHRARP